MIAFSTVANHPAFAKVKNFVIEATGLAYYFDKDKDLATRIAKRMSTLGIADLEVYAAQLHTCSAQQTEIDLLIEELTIGETYFFRHEEQFDALRKIIIPQLLEKNRESRLISIWCAGCSTGAEPYSVSIVLGREFALQTKGWKIEILGTDINRSFLDRATQGSFDDWHLRSMKQDLRSSCFTRKGKSWQINPEYQRGVKFLPHNLVSGLYPPDFNSRQSFDVIFCRNVMIYFNNATIAKILPQFDRCLSRNGWLLLGYSEINMNLYLAFNLVPYPGALIFQKKEPQILKANPIDALTAGFKSIPSAPTPKPSDPITHTLAKPSFQDLYQSYKDSADKGDMTSALASAQMMISRNHLEARGYYLAGLALMQLDRMAESIEILQKAIYLDRKFILAHYYLALAFQRLKLNDKADRYFLNVVNLLTATNELDLLAEGNGMTGRDLMKVMKAMGGAA